MSILLGLPRKDSLYKKYSRKDKPENLKRALTDALTNMKEFLLN